MNTSLSFDRAAGFYDNTRILPEAVATHGIQAILDIAGPEASILDVGTGTGRVSVPLLSRGANLVGCDLSRKMMAVLRQKFPAARLAEADASVLPFPSQHFDAVTTCHVMHLVGPWRDALKEYRRVLKLGGVYINARNEELDTGSVVHRIDDFWESRVKAYGADSRRPGVKDPEELRAQLLNLGAVVEQVEVIRYASRSQSVNETIERIAGRIDSQTWSIPESIFAATVRDLREWASHEFPDPGAALEEQVAFVLDVARFERAA